jgi:ABC-2 type transport system permease protein
MLRGLLALTWIEIKIFLREPMGAIGTFAAPLIVFIAARAISGPALAQTLPGVNRFLRVGVPVLAAVLIAMGAMLSLVTIVSIYREGGILRRLRATPLRPRTILTAHVLVKLLLSLASLVLLMLAGKRFFPPGAHVPVIGFAIALLISTWSILSIGSLIASFVPTARFAQPIGAIILYPMIGLSGLFFPVAALPLTLRIMARALPLTYAVSLMQGIWQGETWVSHAGDVAALAASFVVCMALSAKVFRWE